MKQLKILFLVSLVFTINYVVIGCGKKDEPSSTNTVGIDVSSLPKATALDQKYNKINPSEGSPTSFFPYLTPKDSSIQTKNLGISINHFSELYTPPTNVASTLTNAAKGTFKIDKNTTNSDTGFTPPKKSSFFDSYVYCYYNAIYQIGAATYNQLGGAWAFDRSNRWFEINGYRSAEGSFHTETLGTTIQDTCSYTVKTLSEAKNSGIVDAQFIYYTESKSIFDSERPIWAKGVSPKSQFTNLVAFGDSLSDNGNDKIATLGILPSSPFWGGRFSNGLNWTDYLSLYLNMASFNWAYGGSETSRPIALGIVNSLSTQVSNYINKQNYTDLGQLYGGYGNPQNTLFSIYSGANNYFNNNGYNSSKNTFTHSASCDSTKPIKNQASELNGYCVEFQNIVPSKGYYTFNIAQNNTTVAQNDDAFITATVADIQTAITKLINIGAVHILVPNLPQLANIPSTQPEFIVKGNNNKINLKEGVNRNNRIFNVTKTHNLRLSNMIDALKNTYPNVNFISVDMETLLNTILEEPSKYLQDGTSTPENPIAIATPFTLKKSLAIATSNSTGAVNTKNFIVNRKETPTQFPTACYDNYMQIGQISGLFNSIANLIGYSSTYTSNYYSIAKDTKAGSRHTLCSDPQNHVFFDNTHPTTQVHAIMAYAISQYLQGNQ